MSKNLPVILSTRETAAVLGITPRAVHRRVNAGKLPVYHQSSGYRGDYWFLEEDIQAIAARQKEENKRR